MESKYNPYKDINSKEKHIKHPNQRKKIYLIASALLLTGCASMFSTPYGTGGRPGYIRIERYHCDSNMGYDLPAAGGSIRKGGARECYSSLDESTIYTTPQPAPPGAVFEKYPK